MMMYMTDGIEFESRMGDGTRGRVVGARFSAAKRLLTTGTDHAIDLGDLGGEIICQKDVFLCAAMGTELSIAFSKRLGAGFFGGEGFILQRLRGDGKVFVHAGGTIHEHDLDGDRS